MTPYLEAHPPRRRQYRAPRRGQLSGVIVLHTAESALDAIAPDTGAERVAAWITRRTTPGSYHDLADSDSTVHLVNYDNEAFHVATHRLNRTSIGIGFACRAVDWPQMSNTQRDGFMRHGAAAAAAAAAHVSARVAVPVLARRIGLDQALAGWSGFLAHADADPTRRSDPGMHFPWSEFLLAYRQAIAPPGDHPIDAEEEHMQLMRIIRGPGEPDDHPDYGQVHLVTPHGVGPALDTHRLSSLRTLGLREVTASRAQRDLSRAAIRAVAAGPTRALPSQDGDT